MTTPQAPILSLAYATSLTAAAPVALLTGTSSVSLSPVPNFPTAGFTASVTLQCNSTGASGIIFRYGVTGNYLVVKNPSNLEVSLGTATTGPTGVSINDGTFRQLAVTVVRYDLTHYSLRVYLDSVSVYSSAGQLSCGSQGIPSGGGLVLGDASTGFVGSMSEFRLWGAPLTDDQVATYLQCRLSSSTPGITLWWGLSSTADSGTLSNCNFSVPVIQFRTPDAGANAFLTASWTTVAGATSYDFQAVTDDAGVLLDKSGLPSTQLSYDITDLTLNHIYNARIRGTSADGPGSWSTTATLAPVNLPCTSIGSAWDSASAKLTASWPVVDQAVQYQIFINSAAIGAPQTTATYDMTTLLAQAGGVSLQAKASGKGSTGPASPTSSVAPPTNMTAIYDAVTQTLSVEFTGSLATTGYWYRIIKAADGAQFNAGWLAPSAMPSAVLPAGSIVLDSNYTVQARAISGGSISDWVSVQITPQSLAGPVLNALAQNVSLLTVTAAWQFDETPYASASYYLELNGNVQPAILVSGKTYTYTGLVSGTTYLVRVRASTPGNISLWSQSQSIVLGSNLLAVNLMGLTSNPAGDLTVSWGTVSGVNVSYVVNIYDGSGFSFTNAPISSATTTTILKTTSGVTVGNSYSVRMKATAPNSPDGPWGSSLSVQAGTTPNNDPGDNNNSESKGDPVYVANGAFVYAFIAIQVQGVSPLQFAPTYSSQLPLPTDNPSWPDKPLGARWTHNYNIKIIKSSDGSTVYVMLGNGIISPYSVPSSITGYYAKIGAPNGDTLFVGADLSYMLRTADQTVYLFDSSGAIQTVISPQNNAMRFAYSGGLLSSVTDAVSGRALNFTYYQSGADVGRLQTVGVQGGASVSFDYTAGNLTQFTDVNSNNMVFTYLSNSLIDTISGPDGVATLKNTYDSQNRVLTQKDGRALASSANYCTTFSYQDVTYLGVSALKTTVTDRNNVTGYTISAKNNASTMYSRIDLGGGGIQAVYSAYNSSLQLESQTFYEGQTIPDEQVNGNTTSYEYTGAGLLQKTTWADGSSESYAYDERNNRTSVTGIYGDATIFEYYADNTLKKQTDAAGRTRTYVYKSGGFGGEIQTITDELGNVWSVSYTPQGDLQVVTDPAGNKVTNGYDSLGRLTSVLTQDSTSKQLSKSTYTLYPKSGMTQYQYVIYDDQPDATPFTTAYTYNKIGMPLTVTDTENCTTTFDYDPNYNMTQKTYQPANNVSDVEKYDYDNEDRQIQISYTDSSQGAAALFTQKYGYDNAGRTSSYTDGNSNTYTVSYAMLNPTAPGAHNQTVITTSPAVTVPDGAGTKKENYFHTETYDVHNRMAARTYPAITGITPPAETYAYAVLAPSTGSTALLERVTTYPLANTGQPAAYTSTARYDGIMRNVYLKDQNQNEWTLGYDVQTDPDGAGIYRTLVTVTDQTQRVMKQWFDGPGNLVRRSAGTAPTDQTIAYKYDALARMTTVTQTKQGSSVVTTFGYAFDSTLKASKMGINAYGQPFSTLYYNGRRQVVQESYAVGTPVKYTYNERGMLGSTTNGANQTTSFSYDHAARLVGTNYSDGTAVTQTLDGNGNRLKTFVNGAVSISRTFDEMDGLVQRTDPFGNVLKHSYTAFRELSTTTYPDLKSVTYFYDGLYRMNGVTDWGQRTTIYTYYPNGLLQNAALPGGASVAYGWDAGNRLTSLKAAKESTTIFGGSYTFDSAGLPSGATEIRPLAGTATAALSTFTYNGYTLDKVGAESVTYDQDQNMVTIPGASGALAHNSISQLVSSDSGATAYQYDTDGNRISMTKGGSTTRFVQDPMDYFSPGSDLPYASEYFSALQTLTDPTGLTYGQPSDTSVNGAPALNRLLAETDANNTPVTRYVYGMGLVSQEGADGTFRAFIPDARGNVSALTDITGAVTDRYAYDVFGACTTSKGTTSNRFRFGGIAGISDDGNGMLFARGRYYRPAIYRFVERDMVVGGKYNPQSLNRYAYVNGNPLQYTDPTGLWLGAFGDFVDSVTSSIGNAVGRIFAKIAVVGGAILGGLAALGGVGALGAYLSGLIAGAAAGSGGAAAAAAAAATSTAGTQAMGGNIISRGLTNIFRSGFRRGFFRSSGRTIQAYKAVANVAENSQIEMVGQNVANEAGMAENDALLVEND